MRKLTLRHLCLLALSVIGTVVLSGCSTPNMAYRTYYQDGHCRFYYMDVHGNRVYEWGNGSNFYDVGRVYCRDAHGRLYYQDSFGNRIYRERVCK